MRLAETIEITIGGAVIELRPSLRYALQLERRAGGFKKLIDDVGELNLGTMAELIEPHHGGGSVFINQVFDAGLVTLRDPLLRYVMALAGIDLDETAKAVSGTKPPKTVPFAEHLTELFKIGSGWIGWTPDETLDATPAEIMLAYRGRLDLLKAIFGSGESEKPKDTRPLDEKVRSMFAGRTTKEIA